MRNGVGIGGSFSLEYANPDGTLGWRAEIPNAWTVVGINYLLELCFRGADSTATQTSIWGAGLIDDLGFVGVSSADSLRAHPGWAEFRQIYQSRPGVAARATQLWAPANSGSISSDQPATVTLTAGGSTVTLQNSSGHLEIVGDGIIRGVYLANGEFIGSGEVLVCTAILPPTQAGLAVSRGGSLRIGYTLRAREVPAPIAPFLDGDVMHYSNSQEMVAATGGSIVTTGEERAGVVYYSTTVGAKQPFAASANSVSSVTTLYTNVVSADSATTVYDQITLTTTVGVATHKRTLIDGRPDLIGTGFYRR